MLIIILIITFTIIFCFCGNKEFGGVVKIHKSMKELDDKLHKIHNNHPPDKINKHNIDDHHLHHEDKESLFHYIFTRFYFVIVSTTSLGYGDIYPITIKTRLLTMLYILTLFYIGFS